MTAFQLRKHLAAAHGVHLLGLDYACLLAIHDDEHKADQDHAHDDPNVVEIGHLGGLDQIVYLVFLLIFVVVLLRLLGVTLR